MSDLTDRLRELIKYSESTASLASEAEDARTHRDYYYSEGTFLAGARWQAEQLAPLLEAMVKLSGAVDEMCARYDDAAIRDKDASLLSRGMTIGVRHVFDKVLNELEQVLTKMEGR